MNYLKYKQEVSRIEDTFVNMENDTLNMLGPTSSVNFSFSSCFDTMMKNIQANTPFL